MEQYYYNTLNKPQQNTYNAIKAGLQSRHHLFPCLYWSRSPFLRFL